MKRAVGVVVVLVLAGFALEGGTYGTRDLLALRRQAQDERDRIARLRHDVDSLAREIHALKTDSVTQERVAREQFGMIRSGEHLYQVVKPDTIR